MQVPVMQLPVIQEPLLLGVRPKLEVDECVLDGGGCLLATQEERCHVAPHRLHQPWGGAGRAVPLVGASRPNELE
eukprot:CAMPEP_0197936106 /NCGR_PEP_ID=MMETSP1439-20131203/114400_1 /TAXON_ID=66791 /ORGANISM="Gonyaulax spinifera, Strain CCMP409" /LENGTH=74 /DNA_ID=CAMNT_0043559067 /DNA_START=12 /DNA_END=234 /DNA_ORIENTATION=-